MVALEVAPNVSARGADDVDMGDEVAQRGVSDAESVGSDELREPRRRKCPSDPTCWQGMQVFDHGVQPVSKGVVEPRGTKGKARKELDDGSKVPVVSWYYCFLGARNRTTQQK